MKFLEYVSEDILITDKFKFSGILINSGNDYFSPTCSAPEKGEIHIWGG